MNTALNLKRFGQRVGLVAAMWLAGSCTLALDWEDPENGLPCDAQRRCARGYSCLGVRCVADDSIDEGRPCTEDRQCSSNLVCARRPVLACRKPCSAYFTALGCEAGTYCRPYRTLDDEWQGACVESDGCLVDEDCRSNEICVNMSATASACLLGCEVVFNPDYSDGCASSDGPQYCTPVGASGSQRTICLDTRPDHLAPQQQGGLCDPIETPCARGLACLQTVAGDDGVCRRYCNPADGGSPCTQSQVCTGKDLGQGESIAVCE